MLYVGTKDDEPTPYRIDYVKDDKLYKVVCMFIASHSIRNFTSWSSEYPLSFIREPISDMFEDELNPQQHELQYFELIYGKDVKSSLLVLLEYLHNHTTNN